MASADICRLQNSGRGLRSPHHGNTERPMNLNLPPLPYAVDALEPYISRRTLAAHHGHHHAAYVEKTRSLTRTTRLEFADLEQVVIASTAADAALFNASAQAWNHTFFWYSMRRDGGGAPHGEIAALIERTFGSHDAFSQQFISAASDLFGSGWVWLVLEGSSLRILSTADAGTPLGTAHVPLLTLDLWEHAYYLDYEHRRLDYIAAFLAHLLDWDAVNRRLHDALEKKPPASGRRAARHVKML
jgi:Fe-Mn family superoxide dismutase